MGAGVKGETINAELFLLMHLRHKNTPVARFPPVAYVAMCIESPQCMHLFRQTNLNSRAWTYSAKYMPELVEVARTTNDEFLGRGRLAHHGWHWAKEAKDPVMLHPTVNQTWQRFSLDWA